MAIFSVRIVNIHYIHKLYGTSIVMHVNVKCKWKMWPCMNPAFLNLDEWPCKHQVCEGPLALTGRLLNDLMTYSWV